MSDISSPGGLEIPIENEWKAAVAAVNHRGGIHGHLINDVICDTQDSDNAAVACAQQAVADHVIAVVGDNSETSQFPYLDAAHIPDFNYGGSQPTWTSPSSVIMSDIALTSSTGLAGVLKMEGCNTYSVLSETISPAFDTVRTQQDAQGGQFFGVPFKGAIYIPATAPDMSPYATEAVSSGADCVVTVEGGAQQIGLLSSLLPYVKSGKIKFVTFDIDSLGGSTAQAQAANPIITQYGTHIGVINATLPSTQVPLNAQEGQYISDETTYGPKPADLTSVTQIDWANLQLIVYAGDHLSGTPTGPAVLAYVNGLTNYAPGIVPPVDFAANLSNPFGPRLKSSYVALSRWTGGVYWPLITPFVSIVTLKAVPNYP